MNELDTRAERFLESIRAEGEAACAAIRTETDAEIDRQLDEARQAQQAKAEHTLHFETERARTRANRELSAARILRESGVQFSGDPVLVIADVDRYHPFVEVEMLMPVLGMVRVNNFDEALDEAFRAEHGCQHSAMIHSSNVHNMSRAARRMNTTIFVKNAPSYSGLGFGGEGYTTLTIATPTGEGLTSAKSFTRARRCVLKGDFRII